tara:strand:- start:1785 stop:2300 length:516 start_codon:yes stop_codon:yes gene_type:complete
MDASNTPTWKHYLYNAFLCVVLAGLMTLFIIGTNADMENESSGRVELIGEVMFAESVAQATYMAMLENEQSIINAVNTGMVPLVPTLVEAGFLKDSVGDAGAKVSIKVQDESTVLIKVDVLSNNLFQYGLCEWLEDLENDPAFEKIFSHGKIAQCGNAAFVFSKRYGYAAA